MANIRKPRNESGKSLPMPFSTLFGRVAAATGQQTRTDGIFALLIPAIVIILIVVLSAVIRQEIDRMLLTEKLIEKRFEIALIAEQIDSRIEEADDWASDYDRYLNTILISIELLDKVDMTYAAVFDEALQNVSARSPSYEGSPFEPAEFEEFVTAVRANEGGDLILPFTPPGAQSRPMFLHFRWVPSNADMSNRLLLVVAISKFSINARISTWVQVATILLVVLAFLMTLFVWRRQIAKFLSLAAEKSAQQAEKRRKRFGAVDIPPLSKSYYLDKMSEELEASLHTIAEQSSLILQSCAEPSEAYSAVQCVSEAAAQLMDMPKDMQSIAEIERGTLALEIAPFSLQALLKETMEAIAEPVLKKGIALTTNVTQVPDWTLSGDQMRLQQIIVNLLDNAVKYSHPDGPVRFRVDYKMPADQEATAQLTFTVVDEGAGIADAKLDKMYATFKQADASAPPDFQEVGVKLSISHALAALMEGTLSVQSGQGKGTVFAFTVALDRLS